MTEDGAPKSDEDLTPVSRVRVRVASDAFIYEGLVTLLPDNDRLQSVLNDPRPFLNLTDVEIVDVATGKTEATSYLALNKGAITHVVLLAEEANVATSSSAPKAEPTMPPTPVPSVPPVPPLRRQHDPPTQPFPSLNEDVSDLILDDEDDDIDPSDLLGASGDHLTRPRGE